MISNSRRIDRVEVIRTEEGLQALQGAWTELLAEVPTASIFLTWEWATTWWRHYSQGKSLYVMTMWDRDGRLAGLAPWMLVSSRLGPLSVRKIAFLGSGRVGSDHLDLIARPADRATVVTTVLETLDRQRDDWDILDLEGLAENSLLPSCLGAAAGRTHERDAIRCPYVNLPDDWDTYQRDILSANRRQQLRSRLRRLERDYPEQVAFRRITEASELASTFEALVQLNRSRWEEKGDRTSFDRDLFVTFHRELAAVALDRGWLRLYRLDVAGEPIGVQYCLSYGGVVSDYQRGFDPAWSRYSPGHLLLAHAIREAIQEGALELDLLRGVESYKYSWTDRERVDTRLVHSQQWQGHLWLQAVAAVDSAKPVGRRALPQPVQRRVAQLLSLG